MIGTHLMVDFYGVEAARLNDVAALRACLQEAAHRCGLTALGEPIMHPFPGGGVTGVILLSESHIALHTYPERGFMALDIFSCGAARPEEALLVFQNVLRPHKVQVKSAQRGELSMSTPL